MGLDTTHDCFHGSYSYFMRWRAKVCEVAGYGDINERVGFDGDVPWPEGDPLVILLDHSDCDGEIRWEDAGQIADCLEKLMPAMRRADSGRALGSYANDTQSFIDGLRLAAERKENVEFH